MKTRLQGESLANQVCLEGRLALWSRRLLGAARPPPRSCKAASSELQGAAHNRQPLCAGSSGELSWSCEFRSRRDQGRVITASSIGISKVRAPA